MIHSSYLNNNQPSRQPLIASSASIQPCWTALQNRSIERAMPTKANSTFASSLGNEVANVFLCYEDIVSCRFDPLGPCSSWRHPAREQASRCNRALNPCQYGLPTDPDNALDTVHSEPFRHREGEQSDRRYSATKWISMNDNNRIRPNKIKSDPVQHTFISRNLPIDSIYGSSIARESEDMTISEDR